MKEIKPSGLGVVVDKSKATKSYSERKRNIMIVDVEYVPVKLNDGSWAVGLVIDHREPAVIFHQGIVVSFETKEKAQTHININYYDMEEEIDTDDPIEWIMENTQDAYMRNRYTEAAWRKIIKYLLGIEGTNKEGVASVLCSKHMRWNEIATYKGFKEYAQSGDYFNNELFKDLREWSVNPEY